MLRKDYLISSVLCLLMGITAFAQPPNPLDYFPHHLGDIWEYWYDENPPGGYVIKQNEITKDSLGNDGKYYIETTWFGNFVIDTTTFEVYNWYGKLYRLDADSGDSWIVIEDTSGLNTPFIAVVSDVFQDILFSHPVTVKVINYYWVNIALSESLLTQIYYLASNFGMVRRDVEFSAPEYLIKGAIIDGVIYGTVTSIKCPEKELLPQNFILQQNYPNPFNPKTTIQYELPVAAKIELTVYDLLGRHVKTLVNTRQAAGTYLVEFDGSGLTSGVYLYRLEIDQQRVLTKKMILLK